MQQDRLLHSLKLPEQGVKTRFIKPEFEGGINSRKYVGINGTSRESAKRDLADLESKKID